MKKFGVIKLFALMAMLIGSLPLARAASISILDFEIEPGGSYTAQVNIDQGSAAVSDYQGLQFDLTLPEGITVDYDQTASNLANFTARSQTVTSSGASRFMLYGTTTSSATSNLMSIVFKAADDITPGMKNVQVGGVKFSSPLGQDIDGTSSSFTVTVPAPPVAGPTIYMDDFTIQSPGTGTQPVLIKVGEDPMISYRGFQFDIQLPSYLTIDEDQTALLASLNGFAQKTQAMGDGKYRVMVYSSSTQTTAVSDLLTLAFICAEDAPEGTVSCTISNQIFSTPLGQDVKTGESTFNVTIEPAETADFTIYMEDFTIKSPGVAKQPVLIRVAEEPMIEYRGFQFDIQLPSYLTIDTAETEMLNSLNGFTPKTELIGDGKYRVMVFSSSNQTNATSNLLNLAFSCAEGAPEGTVSCSITNQIFSTPLGQDVKAGESKFNVTIEAAETADFTIYMDDFTIASGGTATQPVNIRVNEEPMIQYRGFQFDITLPSVLSIDKDACETLAALQGFQIKVDDVAADTYRVMVYSSSNQTDATANLINLVFNCEEGAEGTVTYTITNQIFSTPLGQDVKAGVSTTTVTITEELTISLNKQTLIIPQGGTDTVKATVANNTDNLPVTWSISPEGIATYTVGEDGTVTVTGVTPGVTTLTATCGTKTATCEVTVYNFTIDPTEKTIKVGENFDINVTWQPEGFDGTTITWASDNTAVATVDQNGKVTGVKAGTANVTASCGGITHTCVVTVIQPTESIELNPSQKSIGVGESFDITATVTPDDASDKNITWTSSDPDVASVTVNDDGTVTVTGNKVGTVTITATIGEGDDAVTATCTVTIFSFTIDPTEKTVKVGENFDINVTWQPEGFAGETITWTSDNTDVATVDQNGKVTGVKPGTANVTASCGGITLTCVVTVIQPATAIELNPTQKTIEVGETFDITATVVPDDATYKNITWTSSDPNVASITVNDDGTITVTGKKAGTATITATIGTGDDAVTATCVVTVIQPATSIQLNPENAVISVGGKVTITATVLPTDTTDKTVTWECNDPSIASIVDNGDGSVTVTGNAIGNVTITAKCGDVSATATVRVTDVLDISLNKETLLLVVDEYETLIATVVNNHDNLPVTWTSSVPSVASVNQNGKVTGLKPGKTTITVSCGDVSATCEVTVIPLLTLNAYDITVYVGDNYKLVATVYPEDVDGNVTWTIDDSTIATISADGLVTGVKVGETKATASLLGATAECNVKVIPVPASGITVNPSEITIPDGETATVTVTVQPDNVTDGTITWTSDDTDSVITVVDNGDGTYTITANKVGGPVTITFTNSAGQTGTCTINVIPTPAESIQLNATDVEIYVKETFQLLATVLPPNTTDKTVTWASSDADIATVSANGLVTGVAPGVITVTATCGNVTAVCRVTVKPINATSITVNPTEMTLTEGEEADITAEVEPDDVTDPTITWESSDPSVATVDENGHVTAVGEGTCTITARCGDQEASCEVTVLPYNPYNPDDIVITFSEPFEMTVESGTQIDMWAKGEGGNPEGWTFEWTLEGAPNTITTDSELSVTAYNESDQPLTLVYKVHVANSYNDEILKEETGTYTIIVWKKSEIVDTPMGGDWTGNDNGTYVSAVKIREGNKLGLAVNEAVGGYDNDWTYTWTDYAGNEIGDEDEIWIRAQLKADVAAAAGKGKAISNNVYNVTVVNDGPEGQPWYDQTLQTTNVEVYKRPQAPTQLLRKGDGTSCTFVVMMTPLNNQEILDLGYTYVYGYTDASGVMHKLASTPELRYTHTTSDIYNNSTYRFWAYSVWHYTDGSVVTSGLRYLDGSEDYDFDASEFSGTRGDDPEMSGIYGISADETIQGIYTVDGRYLGTDWRQLDHGIYIIITNNSAKKIKL